MDKQALQGVRPIYPTVGSAEVSALIGVSQQVQANWRRDGALQGIGHMAANQTWRFTGEDLLVLEVARLLQGNGVAVLPSLAMSSICYLYIGNRLLPEELRYNALDQKLLEVALFWKVERTRSAFDTLPRPAYVVGNWAYTFIMPDENPFAYARESLTMISLTDLSEAVNPVIGLHYVAHEEARRASNRASIRWIARAPEADAE